MSRVYPTLLVRMSDRLPYLTTPPTKVRQKESACRVLWAQVHSGHQVGRLREARTGKKWVVCMHERQIDK